MPSSQVMKGWFILQSFKQQRTQSLIFIADENIHYFTYQLECSAWMDVLLMTDTHHLQHTLYSRQLVADDKLMVHTQQTDRQEFIRARLLCYKSACCFRLIYKKPITEFCRRDISLSNDMFSGRIFVVSHREISLWTLRSTFSQILTPLLLSSDTSINSLETELFIGHLIFHLPIIKHLAICVLKIGPHTGNLNTDAVWHNSCPHINSFFH